MQEVRLGRFDEEDFLEKVKNADVAVHLWVKSVAEPIIPHVHVAH